MERAGTSSRGVEACSVHSSQAQQGRNTANSNPRSGTSSSNRRQRAQHPQSKFDFYMPLCEVQQGLKRGEILEGILRVNPRNYEDSYISAPDGLMDIYIRGIRDRNRALNGDVVAVRLKPPEDWKILWEAIQDFEECQGKSLFENDAQCTVPNEAPAASVPPTVESPTSNQGWASGWSAQESLRPSDTLEILGLDQLQRQFQEFTNETKSKKPRNRNRKKRDVHKQQSQSNLAVETPLNFNSCETSVSDPPISDNSMILGAPSDIPQDVDINNSKDDFTNSNTQLGLSEGNSNACVDLNLSIQSSGDKTNCSFDNFVSSSEDEQFPKSTAVAPDELSGDEFSNSVSGESAASQQIVQDIEDAEFFAEHQDACNNNEPSEDFPIELDVSQPVDPASEIQNLVEQARLLSMTGETKDVCDTDTPPSRECNSSVGAATQLELSLERPNLDASLSCDSSAAIQQLELNGCVEKPNTADENNQLLLDCTDHSTSDTKMVVVGSFRSVSKNVELLLDYIPDNSVRSDAQLNSCLAKSAVAAFADKASAESIGLKIDNASPDLVLEINTGIGSETAKNEEKLNAKPKKNRRNRGNRKRNKQKEVANVVPVELSTPQLASTPQKIDSKHVQVVENKNKVTPRPVNDTPPRHTPRRNNNRTNHVMTRNITVADILQLPNNAKFVQKTGQVVYIIEKKHSRAAMGYIKKQQDNNPYWAMFSPTDHRLPRILIPMVDCPKGFWERPEDFKNSLFIAMIKEWDENSTFAKGRLARSLGEAGEIEPETDGILLENDIDCSEFDEECLKDLPPLPWSISQDELSKRRDFRDQCVFTIDPATARDLDDAVSIREIEDGLLEVGVHIADVSFFLSEGTPLDYVASRRSTSVYLVQKVVPMLPRTLCEDLCSLNPGEDKLTFSVVWKINPVNCQIVDEWFGRTVIHSCAKFSYEHAQDMIDNGEREWRPDELPAFHGRFGSRDVFWCVQQLHALALKLRGRRFSDGALRLDQIKIQFNVNNETGMASGFSIYEQKDSHRLIEEFMLLANMAVAHRIYQAYPKKAFLRCHPPPQAKMMGDLVEVCAAMGIHLDSATAGSLQASLARYAGEDIYSSARTLVLTHLCSKPMRPAKYFCAGWMTTGKEDFHHYALNVPLYTHFTSPIRRYPDVIVHRLLAASLGLGAVPSQSELELQKIAIHCNDKKNTAKRVHELSCELFLGAFIREAGPLEEQAVVVDVMDHSFDVLITRMGVIKRVYCDKLSVSSILFEKNMGIPKLTLTWSVDGRSQVQQVTVFTMVQVIITSIPKEPIKFNVVMKLPNLETVANT